MLVNNFIVNVNRNIMGKEALKQKNCASKASLNINFTAYQTSVNVDKTISDYNSYMIQNEKKQMQKNNFLGMDLVKYEFQNWLKAHEIDKKTMQQYFECLDSFAKSDDENELEIYESIKSATPTIKKTSFVVNDGYRDETSAPTFFIQQTVDIEDEDDFLGEYTVVYNLEGVVEDEFFSLA